MLQYVLATGRPTWVTNKLLPMKRNGFLEVRSHRSKHPQAPDPLTPQLCVCPPSLPQEVYLTWSFSAIRDNEGVPRGVMTISFETSSDVISSRQIQYDTPLFVLYSVCVTQLEPLDAVQDDYP